jgi:para-nitrobenzyl esterase
VAESQRKDWWGAPHATEIPFVFDTVDTRYGTALTPADAAAAKAAHAYWIAFAAKGAPVAAGQPDWPRFDTKGDRILDFANDGVKVGADPLKARLDLVQASIPGG